jgi:hypothetical protein
VKSHAKTQKLLLCLLVRLLDPLALGWMELGQKGYQSNMSDDADRRKVAAVCMLAHNIVFRVHP